MKYIQFTYRDTLTGVPVIVEPSINGLVFPPVDGLVFCWARESKYPTSTPEFFGTCPDTSDTSVAGVIHEFSQADWENMHMDELAARVPQRVTRRQALQALVISDKYDSVLTALSAIEDPLERRMAQIEFEESLEFDRHRPLVLKLGAALSLDLDDLFMKASKL